MNSTTRYVVTKDTNTANLSGASLLAARAGWLIFAAMSIVLLIAHTPIYFRYLLEQPPELVEALSRIGVSVNTYAAVIVTEEFAFSSIFFLLAAMLFLRSSDDKMALFTSVMLIGLGYVTGDMTVAVDLPGHYLRVISEFPGFVGEACLPIFFFVFPNGRFYPRWIKVMSFFWVVISLNVLFPNSSPYRGANWPWSLWNFIQLFAFGSGILFQVRRYRRLSSPLERQQTKWAVSGFATAILGLLVSSLLGFVITALNPTDSFFILVFGQTVVLVLLWYVPASMLPVGIGLSIMQFRLWDIDDLINRSLIYGTLTALLGAMLFGAVALLQAGFKALTGQRSDLVVVAVTLVIAALFMPLRRRLQDVVDRTFFRTKVDFRQALVDFTQRIRTNVVLKDLTRKLMENIIGLLYISYGALYLRDASGQYYLAEAQKLPKQTALRFTFDAEILNRLHDGQTVKLPANSTYTLLLPMITSQADMEEIIGVLALGPRLSRLGYSRDDQKLLSSLAAQAGTAIHVAQLAEAQRREVEEANRLKSEFLATMSHELRTPLHAIIGYTDVMLVGLAGELNEEQLDYQERIMANADHLLSLINDVLDIAKIEAGRVTINRQPFSLSDWLDEIVAQMSVLAAAKGLDLTTELDERLPEFIVGDPNLVRQIAINLVSNAVKFTESGYVHIKLKLKGKGAWELAVKDTGIGIPSHALEYIFDEFRQVDGSSHREYGGTGLGLSIVRKLSLMMGGNVRVNSQVGEGSIFTVILPLYSAVDEPVSNQLPARQFYETFEDKS